MTDDMNLSGPIPLDEARRREAKKTSVVPEPLPTDTNHDAYEDTPEGQAKELEAEAKRLAGLPLSQRAVERKVVAKRFKVPPSTLDILIKSFQPDEELSLIHISEPTRPY